MSEELSQGDRVAVNVRQHKIGVVVTTTDNRAEVDFDSGREWVPLNQIHYIPTREVILSRAEKVRAGWYLVDRINNETLFNNLSAREESAPIPLSLFEGAVECDIIMAHR